VLEGIRRRRADLRTVATLLPAAEERARSQGEPQPGAEHLLLAACDLADGTAGRALARAGTSVTDLERAIADAHVTALDAVGVAVDEAALSQAVPAPRPPRGVYRGTASLQSVFQRATELVREGGGPLTGAHVLLAAAEEERGTLARALDRLDVPRAALADAARAEIAAHR
jgi:ATP-dependent Clp protease ATP-binding subunit ClpA